MSTDQGSGLLIIGSSQAGVQLAVFTSDFGGGRKQLQIEVRGTDLAEVTHGQRQAADSA